MDERVDVSDHCHNDVRHDWPDGVVERCEQQPNLIQLHRLLPDRQSTDNIQPNASYKCLPHDDDACGKRDHKGVLLLQHWEDCLDKRSEFGDNLILLRRG